LQICWRNRKNS